MNLSIVIPALNEENYIGSLLNCLVAQTYKHFEVVVVDGNSSDLTREVVLGYADKLAVRCINAGKKGISFQRNLGAKNAKYDDIVFLDADGYLEDSFLEKIVNFLSSHQDAEIMTTWVLPLSDKKIDRAMYFAYNHFYLDTMKNIKPQGGGAFVYIKKSVFNKLGGFGENIFVGEDHDLYARAYKNGFKYYLLKDPCIKTSVRRLENDGRLRHLLTLAKGALYMHFVGPIENSHIINYVMDGGKTYELSNKFANAKKQISVRLVRAKNFLLLLIFNRIV